MTKAEYDKYLQSAGWQARRKAALERARHRCQLCYGTKKLQVHHRTYERVGKEWASDLTVLCRACHEHFHRPQKGSRRYADGQKNKRRERNRQRRWKNRRAKNTGPRRGIPEKKPSPPNPPQPATSEDIKALAALLGEEGKTSRKTLAAESGSEVAA